jgi:RNA polymerase sigma-70 factor (ECF subfamily)
MGTAIAMTNEGIYTQSAAAVDAEMQEVQAARKDPRKFEPLYTRYYKQLVTFVYHRTGERETAFDITAQVFYKALEKLDQFESRGVPFSAWLFRIAANEVNQHFRKTKKMRMVSIDADGLQELKASVHPEDTAAEDSRLFAALQQLGEEEMELIDMRFFEQRAFSEMAAIKDMGESACKMRVYRILEKLKQILTTNH